MSTLESDLRDSVRELDPVLWPVLRSRLGMSPTETALALIAKGQSVGAQPSTVRSWILARGGAHRGSGLTSIADQHASDAPTEESPRPGTAGREGTPLVLLAKSNPRWAQLLHQLRAWRASRSSPSDLGDASAVKLKLARALVAGITRPLPQPATSHPANVNARVALTQIALAALNRDDDWTTVVMSRGKLAMLTGWSVDTAGRALKDGRGLFTAAAAQSGVPTRYKIAPLTRRRLSDSAHVDAASALASGEGDHLADAIRSVGHPAWTYSDDLSLAHWLLLVAQLADVDPAQTHGAKRAFLPPARRKLLELGLGPNAERPLFEVLDRVGREAGHSGQTSFARAEDAAERWEQQRAERRDSARGHRLVADLVFELSGRAPFLMPTYLAEMSEENGGDDTAVRHSLTVWYKDVKRHLAGLDLDREVSLQVRAGLAEQIYRHGFQGSANRTVLTRIFGAPVDDLSLEEVFSRPRRVLADSVAPRSYVGPIPF